MMYSPQVIILAVIEVVLISTTFFLMSAPRERPVLQWTGMVMMGITFCWSVVVGCILALNNLTMSI